MWSPPPTNLILLSNEVHVWRAPLDLEAACTQTLQRTLSVDEQARAARFHFPKDRARFIVARGVLRAILGRHLKRSPDELQFCYGPQGKPALTKEAGGDILCFNLAHSEGLALFAVTRGREIGIDLECLRPHIADKEIAEHFFSPGEVATLRALPEHLQQAAFFTCWTRKEAYIKARGEGLSIGLDWFDVTLAPEEPAALLRTRWDSQEASHWSLHELTPGPGYIAALAVAGQALQLKCWQWADEWLA